MVWPLLAAHACAHALLYALFSFAGRSLARRHKGANASLIERSTRDALTHAALSVFAHVLARNHVHGVVAPAAMPAWAVHVYASQLAAYGVHALVVLCDAGVLDRARMLAHHAITLLLIVLSWHARQWHIGVSIMMLCDPSDVALHVAKLARTLGANERSQLALFASFVAVWCWQRLRGIVWLLVVPFVRHTFGSTSTSTSTLTSTWHDRVIAALLVALSALFAAWTREIAIVSWRRVRGGELRDVREKATKVH